MRRALALVVMVLAIMIIAVSCEEPHVHTFSEEWTSDATYHWHKATCGHDEEGDKAEHVWGEYVIDKDSTETEKGSKHRVCSVCGYTETSAIAEKGHNHTPSSYRYNSSRHWKICTDCKEEITSSKHSLTWIYDTDTHYQKCSVCGYTTEKASHSMVKNDEKTKETCSACGYSNTLAVTAKGNTEVKEVTNVTATSDKISVNITKENGDIVQAEIETNKLVANAKPATITATVDATASEGSTEDKKETTVTFPAGALKIIADDAKSETSGQTEATITLEIKEISATETTSAEAKYQKEATEANIKAGEVTTADAVVVGFEFKLIGADSSNLTGKETDGSGNVTEESAGTTVTTYITKGLCPTFDSESEETKKLVKVKYIGNSQGKAPEVVSYDGDSGMLVFTVYHFSKYAVIAENIIATDTKGNMYTSFGDEGERKGILSSVSEGGTITLLKDIKLTSTVEINKTFTLDLNGKTVTTTGTAFEINKGTLTLKNGEVVSSADSTATYAISVNNLSGNAGLVLESTAKITGEKCSGIISKGTSNYTATLKIAGTVTSKGTAVYQQAYGSLTVSGGTITSTEASAVEIGGGNATINGGTLTTDATYPTGTVKSPVVGAALAVSQNANGDSIYVTVNGGTFSAENGKQLAIVNPNNNTVSYTKNMRVVVGSGVNMSSDKIVGTKTGNSSDIDGTYYLDSASALAAGVGAVASINGTNYASFEDAVSKAATGDTITLVDNIKLYSASIITFDKELTINLNGKTIDPNGYNNGITFNIKYGGTVTFKNGTIKGNAWNLFVIENGGSLTLENMATETTWGKNPAMSAVYLYQGSHPAKLIVKDSDINVHGNYGIATNATNTSPVTYVEITIENSNLSVERGNASTYPYDSTGLFVNVDAQVSVTGTEENPTTIKAERQAVLLRATCGSENKDVKIGPYVTIEATGTDSNKYASITSDWSTGTEVPLAALVIGNSANCDKSYPRSTKVTLKEVELKVANEDWKQIWVQQASTKNTTTVSGDIEPSWTNNTDMNGASYPVAKIGSEYKSGDLQTVINNAVAGSTINLLRDVNLDFSAVTAETPAVKIEKSLTIKGNGHSLYNTKAISNNKVQLLTVKNLKEGDKVEIKDLTLKSDTWTNGIRGIQIDTCKSAEVVLDNVNISLPHYYAVYITKGCEGTKLTINGGEYKAWGAVYNHSSKFTLNASESTFDGINVCNGGGVDNSFSTIIVSEYWNENEPSSGNLMTFEKCTLSASKSYPDSDVKQTVVKMRSPVGNIVKFTDCTFTPVKDDAPIWSCSNDKSYNRQIPEADQNTNEVYIEDVKQDKSSADVFWYLREGTASENETETKYYTAD